MLEADRLPPGAFKIRGHHLGWFSDIVCGKYTPRQLSRGLREEHEHMRDNSDSLGHSRTDQEYYEDLIGTTRASARTRERAHKKVLQSFLWLPDESPVAILDNIPDAVCGTCVIGRHCTSRYVNSVRRTGDMRGVAEFKRVASLLGHELVTISVSAEFHDAPTETTEGVLTTAGVTRAVLASGHDWHSPPHTGPSIDMYMDDLYGSGKSIS